MSILLALETSTEQASVALWRDGLVTSAVTTGVQNHSQSMLPMVQRLLLEAGIGFADLSAIAYGVGPGSFTGVRTACALAQGLAFAHRLPLLPVCGLAALAQACLAHMPEQTTQTVLSVLDARMAQLYWALYRHDANGWQTLQEPQLADPPQLTVLAEPALVWCGNPQPAQLAELPQLAALRRIEAVQVPHAAALLRLAAADFAAGRVQDPAQAQPLYLRNKVALTSAERAAQALTKQGGGTA